MGSRDAKKKARAKLVRVFSEFIRLRDSDANGYGKCFTCGRVYFWRRMDNGHYIPRHIEPTTFDEMNCNIQCKKCNWLGEGNKVAYKQRLIEKYGQNQYDLLMSKQRSHKRYTVWEYEELYKIYKEKRDQLLTKKHF